MWHVPAATAYNSRLPSFPPSLLPLRYVIVTRPDTTLRVFGTTNEISALQVGGGGGKDIAVVDRDAYRTLKLPKAPFKLLKPRLLAHLSTPPAPVPRGFVLSGRGQRNMYVERGLLLGCATAAPATTALLPTCCYYSYTPTTTTLLLTN